MSDSKVEIFTFSKKVPCADSDGTPIKEGSVLINLEDGSRGVVTEIGREGHITGTPMMCIGDVRIQMSPGHARVTNNYSKWQHLPHNDQSYEERFLSWLQRPYERDEFSEVSKDEGKAIAGIMAILPDDVVNWETGPCPDNIEAALQFLVEHLENQFSNKQHSTT